MVRKGRDLIFISHIAGDGKSVSEITDQDFAKRNSFIEDGDYRINCLSISNGTYIASGNQSYVVKLKDHVEETIKLTELHMKIMKEENVLISVYTNASGFLWQAMKVDSGTGLGWSGFTGDCELSGSFTSYNKALDDGLKLVQLASLQKFRRETNNGHWGNYVDYLQGVKKLREPISKIKNG